MLYCPECTKYLEKGVKVKKRSEKSSFFDCWRCSSEYKIAEIWRENDLNNYLRSLEDRDTSSQTVAPAEGKDFVDNLESPDFILGKIPAGHVVENVSIISKTIKDPIGTFDIEIEHRPATAEETSSYPLKSVDVETKEKWEKQINNETKSVSLFPIMKDILTALQALNDKIDGNVTQPVETKGTFVPASFQEVFSDLADGKVCGIKLSDGEFDELHGTHNLQQYEAEELRHAEFFTYEGNYYAEMITGEKDE